MKVKIISTLLFLVLILSCPFALISCGDDKGIPSYEKMEIAGASRLGNRPLRSDAGILLESAESPEEPTIGDSVPSNDELPKIEDMVQVDINDTTYQRYYVAPGKPFIVEIHLSNPENYEIQSFTLNGDKYSNYMFEDGSTMDLLRLEYIAPDEPGYFELTIDAIKYIDGTEIKDVRMDGEKTILGGVEFNEEPNLTLSDKVIGFTDISMKALITDPENVIGDEPISFYLTDGKSILHKQVLTANEVNEISITGLDPDTYYGYGILTMIDFVDGFGKEAAWFAAEKIKTGSAFSFKDTAITASSVGFGLTQVYNGASFVSLILSDAQSDEVISTLTELSPFSFDGLLSNHRYKITVNYTYTVGDKTREGSTVGEFKTEKKTAPTVSFTRYDSTADSLSFDFSLDDPLSIITLEKIELFSQDELVFTAENTDVRSFSSLAPNTKYKVKVTYSYDLSDGNGRIEECAETVIPTSAANAVASGFAGDIVKWSIIPLGDAHELIISGEGRIEFVGAAPWSMYAGTVCRVSISDGIKSIPASAFEAHTSLTSVSLPSDLEEIGERAFLGCSELPLLVIPASVKSLGRFAFLGASKLVACYEAKRTATLGWYVAWGTDNKNPSGTSLHDFSGLYTDDDGSVYAMSGDDDIYLLKYNGDDTAQLALSKTVNGRKLKGIMIYALAGHSEIEYIFVPDTVEQFGANALKDCGDVVIFAERYHTAPDSWDDEILTGFSIFASAKELFTDGAGYEFLILRNDTAALLSYKGSESELTVPATANGLPVTAILSKAFMSNTSITKIVMPDSIKTVGDFAFYSCTSLEEIVFSENISSIGISCFEACSAIKEMNIPNGLTVIPENAFKGSSGFPKHYELHDGITEIKGGAFFNTGIEVFVLPYSIKKVDSAFSGCKIYARCEEGDPALAFTGVSLWNYRMLYEAENGVKYVITNDMNAIVVSYSGTDSALIIPETVNGGYRVNKILRDAFLSDTLKCVFIPASVTEADAAIISNAFVCVCYEGAALPDGWDLNWYGWGVAPDLILGCQGIYTDEIGIIYAIVGDETIAIS